MTTEEILLKAEVQVQRLTALRSYINPFLFAAAYQLWRGQMSMMVEMLMKEFRNPEEQEQAIKTFEEILSIREDLLRSMEAQAKRSPRWWLRKVASLLRQLRKS